MANRIPILNRRHLLFALLSFSFLIAAPYVGQHTEFVPASVESVLTWIVSPGIFMMQALPAIGAAALNVKAIRNSTWPFNVASSMIFATGVSALTFPFDGAWIAAVLGETVDSESATLFYLKAFLFLSAVFAPTLLSASRKILEDLQR